MELEMKAMPIIIDDPNWSVLKSDTVYDSGNQLRVVRQCVQLPDNRIVDDYFRIDLPSFATVYAVTEDDEVLLLQQYKHGVGQVCLTLPGGQVDPGEDPEFSARRELLEETGYGGGRWLSGPSLVLHGNQTIAKAHVFVARHVIKIADACSDDLEDATLVTRRRFELRSAILAGELPVTSHVAAVGIAEALFEAT